MQEGGENAFASEKTGAAKLYHEVEPVLGQRTTSLLEGDPRVGRAGNIRMLERVTGSDRGILIYPGGLDRHVDRETFEIFGLGKGVSVFQARYPGGSGFSLRKEVAQTLDHLEARGVKEIDIVTGSYGGIPALLTIYTVSTEKSQLRIRSFFGLKAALQPSDLNTVYMRLGKAIARPFLRIGRSTPFHQLAARSNAPEIQYPDQEVLIEMAKIPTLFVLPPKGRDLTLKDPDYSKYFPNAQIIMDTYPYNAGELLGSALGHSSALLEPELRTLQEQFLEDPYTPITDPPNKFRRVK
jgi:hypothetical protein